MVYFQHKAKGILSSITRIMTLLYLLHTQNNSQYPSSGPEAPHDWPKSPLCSLLLFSLSTSPPASRPPACFTNTPSTFLLPTLAATLPSTEHSFGRSLLGQFSHLLQSGSNLPCPLRPPDHSNDDWNVLCPRLSQPPHPDLTSLSRWHWSASSTLHTVLLVMLAAYQSFSTSPPESELHEATFFLHCCSPSLRTVMGLNRRSIKMYWMNAQATTPTIHMDVNACLNHLGHKLKVFWSQKVNYILRGCPAENYLWNLRYQEYREGRWKGRWGNQTPTLGEGQVCWHWWPSFLH